MELIIALLLTILIEGIVMLIITRSLKKWVLYNCLCNMITNPILNVLLSVVLYLFKVKWAYYVTAVLGELAVLFVEAWLYRLLTEESKRKCFVLSLVTNAASLGLGFCVF